MKTRRRASIGRRASRSSRIGFIAALALAAPGPAAAQLQISGQVETLALTRPDTRGLNLNFRGDSPFSTLRMRLFAQRWITPRIGAFAELLYDIETAPRINGAYLVINEIAGREWLSARAGMAPSPVGNFSLRSTYFNANPLIGVPLVHQHRTTLDGSGLATAADLLRRRENNIIGLPMTYDACWNVMWELFGHAGRAEYSLGATSGSLSNPLATRLEDGVQVMARIGYEPVDGLRLGVSGALGAYIGGPNRDPGTSATSYPGEADDYDQRILGFDAEWLVHKFHFFAEGYMSEWEVPLIPGDDIEARGAYLEGRYDFLPAWFAALRVGALTFSEIAVPSPGSGRTGWDDDVLRIESSLTYRLAREVHLRANWQHSRFLTGDEPPIDLIGVQLRAVF